MSGAPAETRRAQPEAHVSRSGCAAIRASATPTAADATNPRWFELATKERPAWS